MPAYRTEICDIQELTKMITFSWFISVKT